MKIMGSEHTEPGSKTKKFKELLHSESSQKVQEILPERNYSKPAESQVSSLIFAPSSGFRNIPAGFRKMPVKNPPVVLILETGTHRHFPRKLGHYLRVMTDPKNRVE